jgi:outer membrane protein assembly factor BamB
VNPTPVWTADVGEGGTSPVVAGGRLYTIGWADGHDTVLCLDAAAGKEIWKQSYPAPQFARFAEGDKGVYSGPSSTPELDLASGLLYTLGCDGELRCWKADDGAIVWRKNLYAEYGVPQRPFLKDVPRERKIGRSELRDYGYTTAPLALGGNVLVEVGAPDALVTAFDGRTGAEVWRSKHAGFAGHTGGLAPFESPDGPAIALLALREVAVISTAKDRAGETIATFPWETAFANNVQTPAADGASLFVTTYHTHRATARLDVAAGRMNEVWKADYSSRVGTPVLHGRFVYVAGPELYCFDRESGALAWKGGAFAEGGSVVVTGDDRLVVLGSQGDVILAESATRSPTEYLELAKVPRLSRSECWPHVVLADGRIYVKDRLGKLLCLARDDGNTAAVKP